MSDDPKAMYVSRAADRLRKDALREAELTEEQLSREASAKGRLQSGHHLKSVADKYRDTLQATLSKMVKLAFDATGSTDVSIVGIVSEAASSLRTALIAQLDEFLNRFAGPLRDRAGSIVSSTFAAETEQLIQSKVDDFEHGILDGARLMRDSTTSIVNAITNSPGAVINTGSGNVQTMIAAGRTDELNAALAEFLSSEAVRSLEPDKRQGLIDVGEVIETELAKPQPSASKVARWGQTLLAIARDLGVQVAASGLAKLLFGA